MLNQDFKEFIQSLNANGVRYLVVGGYAVAVHGHPRYTKDMAVWIARDEENAARMVRALEDFGFGSLGLREVDFLEPDQIIQLGYPPVRIDVLTTLVGVDFEECFPTKLEVPVDDVVAYFIDIEIDIENLKKNKKASGRLQDLADLENLQ